jgi:hypothetical protein
MADVRQRIRVNNQALGDEPLIIPRTFYKETNMDKKIIKKETKAEPPVEKKAEKKEPKVQTTNWPQPKD